ncbi:hypothetical protein GCM10023214_37810 [Amycolatopsis dongchuanensis]|uniref:Uncharacterized protein n=1 Tax=Amycolatopsis dongchuanensis TaxID=1070866 RepID=A0ABP9QR28_9PSEU
MGSAHHDQPHFQAAVGQRDDPLQAAVQHGDAGRQAVQLLRVGRAEARAEPGAGQHDRNIGEGHGRTMHRTVVPSCAFGPDRRPALPTGAEFAVPSGGAGAVVDVWDEG